MKEGRMRRLARCAVLAGALVVLGAPTLARAEDASSVHDAKLRFEEGLARVKAGDWEGAMRSFQQAYVLHQSDTILWNLAVAEERCDRSTEALAHLREYVRQYPADRA